MLEIAYLFKLKTDDAYIIARQPDLDACRFPNFDKANWESQGTVELNAAGLGKFTKQPELAIVALAERGHFLVHPRDFRWIRDRVL